MALHKHHNLQMHLDMQFLTSILQIDAPLNLTSSSRHYKLLFHHLRLLFQPIQVILHCSLSSPCQASTLELIPTYLINYFIFSYLKPMKHCIVLVDDSCRSILEPGVLHCTKLLLPSSLYVQNFLFNFLSVSKLTEVLNCSVTLTPTS